MALVDQATMAQKRKSDSISKDDCNQRPGPSHLFESFGLKRVHEASSAQARYHYLSPSYVPQPLFGFTKDVAPIRFETKTSSAIEGAASDLDDATGCLNRKTCLSCPNAGFV